MKKIKILIFLGILLCTFFIFNLNYKASANDNFMKIKNDNISYTLSDTGVTTRLYNVTVYINTEYELKNNIILYFKPSISTTTLHTPLNRGYNSYNIINLNKIDNNNNWELHYEIALLNSLIQSYDYDIDYILSELIDIFIEGEPSPLEYLREYFYRIPPSSRPINLYEVGMNYSSGSAYAGRLYWMLEDYIDISDYISDYNLFLSYTTVQNTNLRAIFFYDENKNLIAYCQRSHFEEFIYKFDYADRYVVGMLHFIDTDTGRYVNFDNVKYMRFEYITEPYPDDSVLINLTQKLDISIGEYWRNAEAFNSYYQAGYDEGKLIGFADGQKSISDEISDILKDEYDRGYDDGLLASQGEAYELGYQKGANESFIGTMDKWLVPAIIIVMILGGYFAIARKKREGEI